MVRAYTWDQLNRLTVPRQFGVVRGRGPRAVVAALGRYGPMQTQTARSTFLGLTARVPTLDHASIAAAFEAAQIVRGSTVRGTVHTATPAQHVLLDTATRLGQRALWNRTIKPQAVTLEQVWTALEGYAEQQWRTPAELGDHLADWLATHDPAAAGPDRGTPFGRYFAFGHGGLVRRPLTGRWDGQAAPGYRSATGWVAERDPTLAAEAARSRGRPAADRVDDLVRMHLRAHGPATRQDVAWWSGLKLGDLDAALGRLAEQLVTRPGPDGRDFLDLEAELPRPRTDTGVRLLPEFDAILCGYHPSGRDRFIAPHHHRLLWNESNGMLLAPMLLDGRCVGYWRLVGTGRSRRLEAHHFADAPAPSLDQLTGPAAGIAAALELTIGDIAVVRAG